MSINDEVNQNHWWIMDTKTNNIIWIKNINWFSIINITNNDTDWILKCDINWINKFNKFPFLVVWKIIYNNRMFFSVHSAIKKNQNRK